MFKFIISTLCIIFFSLSTVSANAAIKDRPEEDRVEDIRG